MIEYLDNDAENAPPPKKRRRISYSSSSDQSDTEDASRPLAARVAQKSGKTARKTGQKGGKMAHPSNSSKGNQAKTIPRLGAMNNSAHKEKAINGVNGHDPRVKVEDKMNDVQITRLAAGVPVDAASPTTVQCSIRTIDHSLKSCGFRRL